MTALSFLCAALTRLLRRLRARLTRRPPVCRELETVYKMTAHELAHEYEAVNAARRLREDGYHAD